MTQYTKINDLEGKKLVEPEGQDSFYAIDTVQGIENDIQGLTNAIQKNTGDAERLQAEKETNEATLSQRQEDLVGLRACGVISLAEKAEAERLAEEARLEAERLANETLAEEITKE